MKALYSLALQNHKITKRVFDLFPAPVKIQIKKYFYKMNEIKAPQISSKLTWDNNAKKYSNDFIDVNLLKGMNLVGFAKGDLGLGEQLRYAGRAVAKAKIEHCYNDFNKFVIASQNNNSVSDFIASENKYNTNLLTFNGDTLGILFNDRGLDFFKGRYNIHFGAWELETYPRQWLPAMNVIDEFWAMSSFLQDSVSRASSVPVLHMPIPIEFEIPGIKTRKDFALPDDKFLFLFSFDMSSVIQRKNPWAALAAFKSAFSDSNKDVGLVVKISYIKTNQAHIAAIKELKESTSKYNNIYYIDEVLDRSSMLDLMNLCDCYISLHRSEGFGLGMAETMKMGKPVIATNYSGNTDFMKPNNSCLVDYKMVKLKPDDYVFCSEGEHYWAEASSEHAADYMKRLAEDSTYRERLGQNAKSYIDEHYNFTTIGKRYRDRLELLGLL